MAHDPISPAAMTTNSRRSHRRRSAPRYVTCSWRDPSTIPPPMKPAISGATGPSAEAKSPARSGGTAIGTSMRSARSIGSKRARIFSGASHKALPRRSAWSISRLVTADIWPNAGRCIPLIRSMSVPGMLPASASFFLMAGDGTASRSFPLHG